jgi:predicted DNA-binding protein
MPQIAIYLDNEIAKRLTAGAAKAGKSRSAFAREAIEEKLEPGPLPDWWFDLLGTWEDDRSAEEILRDIKSGPELRDRASFD